MSTSLFKRSLFKRSSVKRSSVSRRLALAGVLGGAVLVGVGGVAYAGTEPVETGWATVADGSGNQAAEAAPADDPGSTGSADCPEGERGAGTDDGSTEQGDI